MSKFFREFITENPKVTTANSADIVYLNVNGANRSIEYGVLVGLIRALGLTEAEQTAIQNMINATLQQDGVLTSDDFAAVGITDFATILTDSDIATSFATSQNDKLAKVGDTRTYVNTAVADAVGDGAVGLPVVSEMTISRSLSITDLNRYIRNSTGNNLTLTIGDASSLEISVGFEFYVSAKGGGWVEILGGQNATFNGLNRIVIYPGSHPVRFKFVSFDQTNEWEVTSSEAIASALINDDTFYAEATDPEFNNRFVQLWLLKSMIADSPADVNDLATVQIAKDIADASSGTSGNQIGSSPYETVPTYEQAVSDYPNAQYIAVYDV